MGQSPTKLLQGRRIGLCVSGGIAAYKSLELLRGFVKAGAEVQVAMTRGAMEFVQPLSFQALSGKPVFTDLFSMAQEAEIGHIALADSVDLVVVAPATANLLSRLWAGQADDPVTAMVLATKAPVLVAPAMNVNMWNHPATQRNWSELKARGVLAVEPEEGYLACGWQGAGRMSEPSVILEHAAAALVSKDLKGKVVVVTAGPTQEDVDPVRFISNRSSGKMGYALADAAVQRGADVHLISGPTSLGTPHGIAGFYSVRTASEMDAAVQKLFDKADAILMAAAVGDLTPEQPLAQKWKKNGGGGVEVAFKATKDILADLGSKRTGNKPLLVGFAAETRNLNSNAADKLSKKKVDLIVGNDVSRNDIGFGVDENEVTLFSKQGNHSLGKASKALIATQIVDWCADALGVQVD